MAENVDRLRVVYDRSAAAVLDAVVAVKAAEARLDYARAAAASAYATLAKAQAVR